MWSPVIEYTGSTVARYEADKSEGILKHNPTKVKAPVRRISSKSYGKEK